MTRPAKHLAVSELVRQVVDAMSKGSLTPDSRARFAALMSRFVVFAQQGCEIRLASEVTTAVVESFISARSAQGSVPATATKHIRRSAVRLLFAEGRRLGLVDHDPTMDVTLPPRSSLRTRPLTDDEVMLCRSYSLRTLRETRQPAAWALAEATTRSAELARIRVKHFDLERRQVWIPGSSKTDARWGNLSAWGAVQVERRLNALANAHPETLVVCVSASPGVSATSSASTAIADILWRAGLNREPDVRPTSVAAWAGSKALAAGEPIERVALMLGIRSLDRAAAFIGWAWQETPR